MSNNTRLNKSPSKALPPKRIGGREKLIAAASELFWINGYESTSPHDLYTFSGVGQGSFYHHFTGKLDLLNAVLEQIATTEINLLEQIDTSVSSPLDRLYRYLSVKRDGQRGCKIGRYVHESSIEKPEVHNPIRRYFSYVEKFLSDNVSAAQQQGEISTSLDPDTISKLILSSVQGGYVIARAHGRANALDASIAASKQLLDNLALPKRG